jgi:2-polyprenyl-3-methyl-5-hydroxy-6-metoxy-1,4-benzoquinol methylase
MAVDLSSDVKALLGASDAELLRLPVAELEDLCALDSGGESGNLWPPALERLFSVADPTKLRLLHWITETYYGDLMRSDGGKDFWRLSALAYTRIIRLRLGYDESMGHRRSDSLCVDRAVGHCLPHGRRDAVRVLDVGCGTGELLADLISFGYTDVEGIDVSNAAITRARARLAGTPASVQCMSLRRLVEDPPRELYDVVALCDVLEHLPRSDAPHVLRQLGRLLATGGFLFIATPSAITGPHDLDFVPRNCAVGGLHLYEYSLRELAAVLREAGYEAMKSPWLAPTDRLSIQPSAAAVRLKMMVEPILGRLPYRAAAWATERFYFRGVVCRRS